MDSIYSLNPYLGGHELLVVRLALLQQISLRPNQQDQKEEHGS
jgi:hypothetical protein